MDHWLSLLPAEEVGGLLTGEPEGFEHLRPQVEQTFDAKRSPRDNEGNVNLFNNVVVVEACETSASFLYVYTDIGKSKILISVCTIWRGAYFMMSLCRASCGIIIISVCRDWWKASC